MIEFTQDNCDLLNSYAIGDNATVSINLRGKMWTNPQGVDKYFNSLNGWRIEKAASVGSAEPFETTSAPIASSNEPDDLPF